MDAQGPEAAKPYVEKANASFPCLVDEENQLGQLLGFKAIPNGLLVDEAGVIQYKRFGGFEIRRPETRQLVEQWAAGASLGDSPSSEAKDVAQQAMDLFHRGLESYRGGRRQEALDLWRQAVELDPENYVVRKQLWAVEHPERFYEGPVDFDWQREQMAQGR